jgi:DNA-binding NarL/FixJ family response regulator
MGPIRIVLIDDHHCVRRGLRSILEPDPQFEVVDEAATGADALRVVKEQQPDVVLLDLRLPDMSGVELCRCMVQASPRTAVLILTAFFDRDLVDSCLMAGARGYLLKDAENLCLQEHVLAAVRGCVAQDPRAAKVLADQIGHREPLSEKLDRREIEVLRLIAQGLTNKEIGLRLAISKDTVKGCVEEILVKVHAHSRIEAVLLARESGFL